MKIKKEVKVGLVMLLSIALLFWGANYLKGNDIFNDSRHFYAVYDHIDGLTPSSPVLINGFKVGQVEHIDFMSNKSGKLLVKFSVQKEDFFIPEDSQAKIHASDILGSKSIDLILGSSITQVENLDTLGSDIEATLSEAVNQQIAPLKLKAEELISDLDSAIIIVSSIFNEKARGDLNQSFTNIKDALHTFEQTMIKIDGAVADKSEHIGRIFDNVESITSNFAKSNSQLTAVIDNMESITDSLAASNLKQAVNNASTALTSVAELMEKVNNGEGSLGALMNNDTLYTNVESAARDLDSLMIDLRNNPHRYVHFSIFGRKNKDK